MEHQVVFHREFHHGAIDHFLEMKIDAAKQLIRDGTMNFTEIAHYLSFGSLQYFSKRFKQSTGMAPMEYATSVKNYSNSQSLSSNLAKRHGTRRSYDWTIKKEPHATLFLSFYIIYIYGYR